MRVNMGLFEYIALYCILQVVRYNNTWDIIVRVSRDEGLLAWYKGLSVALIKSASASTLTFVTYEAVCQMMLQSIK